MEETRKTRSPQQRRSIDKKERIIDAAYTVFCAKGFYKTTTIEIAKKAGVSIGCLYSYFSDKNDLFTVILDRYDAEFDAARERALQPVDGETRTHAEVIRAVMTALLEEHEGSRELNREIKVLSFSDPAIATRMERQSAKIQDAVRSYLHAHQDELRPVDVEAATVVVWKTISALVDGMVFEPLTVDRERILNAAVDALCAYLVK